MARTSKRRTSRGMRRNANRYVSPAQHRARVEAASGNVVGDALVWMALIREGAPAGERLAAARRVFNAVSEFERLFPEDAAWWAERRGHYSYRVVDPADDVEAERLFQNGFGSWR